MDNGVPGTEVRGDWIEVARIGIWPNLFSPLSVRIDGAGQIELADNMQRAALDPNWPGVPILEFPFSERGPLAFCRDFRALGISVQAVPVWTGPEALDYARQRFDMIAPSFQTVRSNLVLKPISIETFYVMQSRSANGREWFFYLGETPASALKRQTEALMNFLGTPYESAFDLVLQATSGRTF